MKPQIPFSASDSLGLPVIEFEVTSDEVIHIVIDVLPVDFSE